MSYYGKWYGKFPGKWWGSTLLDAASRFIVNLKSNLTKVLGLDSTIYTDG